MTWFCLLVVVWLLSAIHNGLVCDGTYPKTLGQRLEEDDLTEGLGLIVWLIVLAPFTAFILFAGILIREGRNTKSFYRVAIRKAVRRHLDMWRLV